MAAGSPRNESPMQEHPSSSVVGPTDMGLDKLLGLLRIRIKRGLNLAVRDVRSSDPYVVVRMGTQRMKTRVIRKDVNPEWNEDLTLSVTNPEEPVFIEVYDHDTFSMDDSMGNAELDIQPFVEALKIHPKGLPNGTRIKTIQPSRSNCLVEESSVVWRDGKIMQDMCLRLKNVECGELQLQLQWVDLPGSKAL
ncbi:hypothetical protein SASPL_118164 [Salvia splendens]|uniref:C2 domain-containing protein n=2 Tax=Salvia splendens TaxID=180675 RepID=A0A8X8ZX00_SALSN|nr:hypothetical protein SASPL_118164 [Salvia splendens]